MEGRLIEILGFSRIGTLREDIQMVKGAGRLDFCQQWEYTKVCNYRHDWGMLLVI